VEMRLFTSIISSTDGKEALKLFTAMSFIWKDIYAKMAASLGPVPRQTKW
jgi:hypothetical protein